MTPIYAHEWLPRCQGNEVVLGFGGSFRLEIHDVRKMSRTPLHSVRLIDLESVGAIAVKEYEEYVHIVASGTGVNTLSYSPTGQCCMCVFVCVFMCD
jgi:hypothetical protein